jgi:hypothetical protein
MAEFRSAAGYPVGKASQQAMTSSNSTLINKITYPLKECGKCQKGIRYKTLT